MPGIRLGADQRAWVSSFGGFSYFLVSFATHSSLKSGEVPNHLFIFSKNKGLAGGEKLAWKMDYLRHVITERQMALLAEKQYGYFFEVHRYHQLEYQCDPG